jgi:hypothetical protein
LVVEVEGLGKVEIIIRVRAKDTILGGLGENHGLAF